MRRHCSGPRQFLPAHARRIGGLPAAGAAEGGRGESPSTRWPDGVWTSVPPDPLESCLLGSEHAPCGWTRCPPALGPQGFRFRVLVSVRRLICRGWSDTPHQPPPAFLQIADAACNFMQIHVEVSVGSDQAPSGRVRISIGRENAVGARIERSGAPREPSVASSARSDTWPQLGDVRVLGWRWPVPRAVHVRAENNADSDWDVPLALPAKVSHVRHPAQSLCRAGRDVVRWGKPAGTWHANTGAKVLFHGIAIRRRLNSMAQCF